MRADEARRVLKGSSCDLAHLREAGKLRFERHDNAFRYAAEDVAREEAERRKQRDGDIPIFQHTLHTVVCLGRHSVFRVSGLFLGP